MRKFSGLFCAIILLLSLIVLPQSAIAQRDFMIAASSSFVTSTFESKSLKGEDFTGQNLQQAEFTKVNLQEAKFNDSDLRGAVFNGVNAEHASFVGVDMSDGLVYVTSFNNADLSNGIFRDAIMLRTTFKNANVEGADFTFTVLDSQQVNLLCENASGINPVTNASTRQSLGCP